MAVKYRTPHEYKDSDIWFRFFTKTELLILAPSFALDAYLILNYIAGDTAQWIVAALIIIAVTVPSFALAKGTVPRKFPLLGGGIRLRKVALRMAAYYLFKKNRTVYTRNYDRGWKKKSIKPTP